MHHRLSLRPFASLLLLLAALSSAAQQPVISLYEGKAPGSEGWAQPEKQQFSPIFQAQAVYNVVSPTLTVVAPAVDPANGTGIIICPGGGFQALSINQEGFDVARQLAAQGFTCFVLKYRVLQNGAADLAQEMAAVSANPKAHYQAIKPVIELALADGLRAVAYVRQHAGQYGLSPRRVGLLGFSAGGTLVASVAYHYTASTRPDFVAPIYLQYDWTLRQAVPADAPPLFLVAAADDQLGLAPHTLRLYQDWLAAHRSAELHLFARGGHGFGAKQQHLPSDNWPALLGSWLNTPGLLAK